MVPSAKLKPPPTSSITPHGIPVSKQERERCLLKN